MRKLLLLALFTGMAFAKDSVSSHLAEELYKTGMDSIRSNISFLKGFGYLRASCALMHRQACEDLEELIREVTEELRKFKVLPDRDVGEFLDRQG